MEYFDLVDSEGGSLNKTKLRKNVHRDGDWHRAVDIWILNSDNQLLLQKRAPEKESYPNLWEVSCSGHISAGENSMEAAVKELEEELGLIIDPSELRHIFTIREEYETNNGTFINKEIKDVYLLKLNLDITRLNLQREEVTEVKFMSIKDLKIKLTNSPEKFVPHKEMYLKLFDYLNSQPKTIGE